MIIGIDGNEANVMRRVGIGEYGFELLKKLEEFRIHPPAKSDLAPSGGLKFRVYLKTEPLHDLPKQRDGWEYRIIEPKKLWTQIGLPFDLYIHKPRPDVFFSPTHYAPRFCPVPYAISIMDLSYLYYPEMFKANDLYQLRQWTKYSIKKATVVFTISNSSKDDIIKQYGISEDKVVVTYPGIKLKVQSDKLKMTVQSSKLIREKYKIDSNYILFVGTLQPRKNIVRLIEAFSLLGNTDLLLVIVGKKGWLFEEILAAPKKYNIENRVKFLDFVSDEELGVFYENAQFFILPSLYEGFGLPVLEAMRYGCPVITSNVSSLPEAGGDAALYVDPLSINDIKEKMEMLLDDKKLRQELIKKGREQIRKFSWEKTARQTLDVLKTLVK